MTLQWQQVFETDIPKIDNQHKKLVAMINQLKESHNRGEEFVRHELNDVLVKLVEYTAVHFKDEEELMVEIGFTELKRHQKLHHQLKKRIASVLRGLQQGKSTNYYEMLSFLQDWLINHILHEDKKIGREYVARITAQSQVN